MEAEVEETAEEPVGGHRPLPSVDMPLLRDQRRAERIKWIGAGVLALLLVVGGIVAAILLPGVEGAGDEEGSTPAAAAAPPALAAAASDAGVDGGGPDAGLVLADETTPQTLGAVDRIVRRFGEARGFRHALQLAGFDGDECGELEKALEDVMDFRRCRPRDQMVIERDAGGNIVLFEYHGGSATEYYQATRNERGELRGEKVEIPIERVRLAKGGRVRVSIGDALDDIGLGRTLVGTFVSIFEGKVNFSRDTRTGDTFKIIVDEEHVQGEFLRYGRVHAVEYVGERTGTLRAFWFQPGDDRGDYYDEEGRALKGGWLRTPCRYDHISSRFDPRRMHPVLRRIVPHNGVDYAAGTGTPVWAAADGRITFAGMKGANGNLVSIRHPNGYMSHYAHLSRIENGIRPGVQVEQREVIGYVGSTGRSTGPHLHFGLKKGSRFVDPIEELNGPGRMMASAHLPRYRRHVRRLMAELERIDPGSAPPAASEDAENGSQEEGAGEPMD